MREAPAWRNFALAFGPVLLLALAASVAAAYEVNAKADEPPPAVASK